jgi:hypothetical protein
MFDVRDILNPRRRVSPDDEEIGLFAGRDAADTAVDAEESGSFKRSDPDGVQRRKPLSTSSLIAA